MAKKKPVPIRVFECWRCEKPHSFIRHAKTSKVQKKHVRYSNELFIWIPTLDSGCPGCMIEAFDPNDQLKFSATGAKGN